MPEFRATSMCPAVRLAALLQPPATDVGTHDSIVLGEEGPTHQPVERVAALPAIAGLSVGLALTRQTVPVLEGVTTETDRPGR